MLLCYVDDIAYAVEDAEVCDKFLSEMKEIFYIGKVEGSLLSLLGMSIKQCLRG